MHNIPIKFRTKNKKIPSPSALQKQYKKYIKRNENMFNIKNNNLNLTELKAIVAELKDMLVVIYCYLIQFQVETT